VGSQAARQLAAIYSLEPWDLLSFIDYHDLKWPRFGEGEGERGSQRFFSSPTRNPLWTPSLLIWGSSGQAFDGTSFLPTTLQSAVYVERELLGYHFPPSIIRNGINARPKLRRKVYNFLGLLTIWLFLAQTGGTGGGLGVISSVSGIHNPPFQEVKIKHSCVFLYFTKK